MKIAVLSRNEGLYSSRRIIEAGRQRGHDIYALDYMQCNVMVETNRPGIFYSGKPLELPDAVIPRIGASKTFYGAAVVRQFEMMGIFTTVKSMAIVRSRDKLRSMQILSKHGVGMPKSAFAGSPSEIKSLIKTVGGPPIIIKLLEGTQGNGVVLAETINAAKSALDAFYGLKANILIQEFIKEAKGMDVRAFVVGNRVVGSMVRQGAIDEFRSNLHQGGVAKAVELTSEENATALSAAKALGMSIAGVDILRSSRGPLVMEVNSSPGLEGIENSTGINIAETIIKYIEDNVSMPHRDEVGA